MMVRIGFDAFGRRVNPCVQAYGLGPDGATCKTCRRLYRKHFGKTYIKCDLRPNTRGPGSDHRVGYPACAKYEATP